MARQMAMGARQTVGGNRQRGVGFPRLSLAVVAELLRQAAHSYGPTLSREAFAALGARRRDARASTRSGTYLTKLAAFKDFGLVEVTGRQVRLTELAQRIALPTSAAARREALGTAFQQAAVFRRVYDETPKGEPVPTETIVDRAIWQHGVAASARSDFSRAFVESAATAGLLKQLDRATVRLIAEATGPGLGDAGAGLEAPGRERAVPDVRPPMPAPAAAETAPRPSGRREIAEGTRPTPADPDLSPILQQRWTGPGYAIGFEIRANRPLRPELFRQLADIMAEIEQLAVEIGSRQ